MGLRDYISKPAATAIPAILRFSETQEQPKAPRIAKIATIAAPSDPFAGVATVQQEAEIRHLLELLLPGLDHPDFPEAFALARDNVDVHLMGLRASAKREGLL